MKIVDRKTFLSMPSGTLFSKYKPSVFDNLMIKGNTLENCGDFMTQQIVDSIDCDDCGEFHDKLDDSQANGTSIDMDFHYLGRDGCFDHVQLFSVWEEKDLAGLIDRLKECLSSGEGEGSL